MSYTPINYQASDLIPTPAQLRQIETQYEKAMADAEEPIRTDIEAEIKAELLTENPTAAIGRIYYNTNTNELRAYNGDAWQILEG